MNFQERYNTEWVSSEETALKVHTSKQLDILEHELADIKNNLLVIEEKQRILANLSKLYN